MKKEQFEQLEDLTKEFKQIVGNLGFNGGTVDNDAAARDLSIANKKLAVYGNEFGHNAKLFKDLQIMSQKATIKIEENNRSSSCI